MIKYEFVAVAMSQSQVACNACSSGDLVMGGKGTYSELFSDGSGNRYLSGLQGQINIKHDGSGSVHVQPGTSEIIPCTLRFHQLLSNDLRPWLRCILCTKCNHLVRAAMMPVCFHQRRKASMLSTSMKWAAITLALRLRYKPVLPDVQATQT